MERYIAVDNVCAWPNLTRFPDGTILATIFNQPTHGRWEGDVDCWASKDGGRTWSWRATAVKHDPGGNRMNVAAGLCPDSSMLVIASGWSNRPPRPASKAEEERILREEFSGQVLPALVCRSTDQGASWQKIARLEQAHTVAGQNSYWIPYGDIINLSDGRICFASYSALHSGVKIQFSSDNGHSWTDPANLVASDLYHNETALLALGGGNLLAAVRCEKDKDLELYRSRDKGQSWSFTQKLTLPGQHPGHLLQLADGSLLLVYGIRNRPFCGIGARLSKDKGFSWSEPVFLVNLENVTDCGYPSSVQNADGTIVTAYYTKNMPGHNRYHMGVVLWQIEEFFPA